MKILVINGDNWHPPEISQKGLGAINNSYHFEFTTTINGYARESMETFDIIILAKANDLAATNQKGWIEERTEEMIKEYIQMGKGFLAIHSGIAEYENNPTLRSVFGGIFHHHPDQCEVTIIPKVGHQLTKSMKPFTEKDEHYFLTIDDPAVDIFLTANSEHGSQPAGWKRLEGKGRVAVITPGHNLEVWVNPNYQTVLQNVFKWCSGIT